MTKLIASILFVATLKYLSNYAAHSQSLERCGRDVTTMCQLTPQVTEGPYYWNTSLMRQNVSEDRAGIRFSLQIVVMDVNTCSPIANAAVVLWHCDSLGIYSHFIQASENLPNPQNDNATFLRGIQLTNSSGVVMFDTIYPGWYVGRAIHMHVKVYLGGTYLNQTSYYSDAQYVYTGQLFFNDSLSDLVMQQSAYIQSGTRTLNNQDSIYASTDRYTLMNVQYVNSAQGFSGGMVTSIALGVNSTVSSTSNTTASSVVSSSVSSSAEGRIGGRPFWLC